MEMIIEQMQQELQRLGQKSNLRHLPILRHQGREICAEGRQMLNLSSNDYLGLGSNVALRREFLEGLTPETFLPTAAASRLLTGNFAAYQELEEQLAQLFGTEAALTFNSGYHANTGILPAVCDGQTLILADKRVHASLIDGIRLCAARCIRYRHNDYTQLARLVEMHHRAYTKVVIVTESIFSMDGDEADLDELVRLKRAHANVLLYVDEAHAFGVRGRRGLGCAEEHGCIAEVDFLVGTFGKALASAGAYIVCRSIVREYLINKMRTFIFTTALPPVTVQWTSFVLQRLPGYTQEREHLHRISGQLREALEGAGFASLSSSHIVPMLVGESADAIGQAEELQRKGFYVLPVRPPTVPEGSSRLRFSLTAAMTEREMERLIQGFAG